MPKKDKQETKKLLGVEGKEPEPKEPEPKEPKTKEPKTKEPKTKEPKTKEPKTKELEKHKYVGKMLGTNTGKIASVVKITLSGREYNEVSLDDGTTYRLNNEDLDKQVK